MEESTNGGQLIYLTISPVLFSPMAPTKNGFSLQWKPWKPRILEIYEDAMLVYKKDTTSPVKGQKFNLRKVVITLMDQESVLPTEDNSADNDQMIVEIEKGMTVKCSTPDGFDAYFRVIFKVAELERFTSAIERVSLDVKYTKAKRLFQTDSSNVLNSNNNSMLPPVVVTVTNTPQRKPSFPLSFITGVTKRHKRQKHNAAADPTQSIMRSTIAYQMDRFDLHSTRDRIVARRGEMKWLPVMFANDLVHGSWWFVVGSVAFIVSSLVMLINSYHVESMDLGSDDSGLSPDKYRATWYLMIISGIFSTAGSMAFVRAMYQDPPMKPLFHRYYHFQSDELLGSWLFLFACIPLIPYCLIYLANDNYNSLVYLGALALAILMSIGTFLFVRACYPNDKVQIKIFKPISRVLCFCCCRRSWMRKHLANDWLAGTWFTLWASFGATVSLGILMIAAIAKLDSLKIFLMTTSFFENFCFMVGSAYFVAGSYPETSLLLEDDEYDDRSPSPTLDDGCGDIEHGITTTQSTRQREDSDEDISVDNSEEEGSDRIISNFNVDSSNYGNSSSSSSSSSGTSPNSSGKSRHNTVKSSNSMSYSHRKQPQYHNISASLQNVDTPSYKSNKEKSSSPRNEDDDDAELLVREGSTKNPLVFND